MASATTMSVAQLAELLSEQKGRLGELKKRRTALERELGSVVAEIEVLEGAGTGRGRGRKASAGGVKTVRRRRSKNAKSLKTVVTEVLGANKKGLSLQEVHDSVLGSGYKTKSKNFKNVLYQCLYHTDDFMRDEKAGVYKLKS